MGKNADEEKFGDFDGDLDTRLSATNICYPK